MFLPFVAAYYLSFLFRTINATVAGALTAEFGLGAGDLGLLTSVYYLTFAAAQIPIGIVLDRYGPGRIQSSVMVAAALGAALFAISENFWLLLAESAVLIHGRSTSAHQRCQGDDRAPRRAQAPANMRSAAATETIADELTMIRAEMSVMRDLLAMIAAKR